MQIQVTFSEQEYESFKQWRADVTAARLIADKIKADVTHELSGFLNTRDNFDSAKRCAQSVMRAIERHIPGEAVCTK